MGFAVYHMEKGSGCSGGIGKHIDREKSKDGHNTFEHADISKQHLNQSIKVNDHCSKPLSQAIEDRIKEGYTQTKAIRKDAVRFQTHILTGSHEDMKKIFENKSTSDKWIQDNIAWMSLKYGKENIVRFTLHMDEKTPHIHAVTVPITQDGRLSAKSYANGKKALRELQTDYAKSMEHFGLERGLERIGVKHESAQEYYARNKKVDEYMKNPKLRVIEPKKSLFKTNIDEIYKQNQYLSMLMASTLQLVNEQKRKIAELSDVSQKAIHLSRKLTTNKDNIIDKEVNQRTNIYQKELKARDEILLEHKKILNDPDLLINRAREIEVQQQNTNHKELLDQFEKNILSEAKLKIELDEKIRIEDIDNWIRHYSPQEELKELNPWTALNVITGGKKNEFENQLHQKIKELEDERKIELNQQRDIQKDIEIPDRKRGRRL